MKNNTSQIQTNDKQKPNAQEDNPQNENFKYRKSPRASFHNYSGGIYLITICTNNKIHYFGEITNGKMQLSDIGIFAQKALDDLHTHYKYAQVPLFVVMPNHVHIIICIDEYKNKPQHMPTHRTALSVVIGGFKQSVTCFARRNNIDFCWQGRYHDHIIRGIKDGNKIADYIKNNVEKWNTDCFNNNRLPNNNTETKSNT